MDYRTTEEKNIADKQERLKFLRDNEGYYGGKSRFPLLNDLTEEFTEYMDIVGMERVLTNIFRFLYDPNNRPPNPVALVKDKKQDQREKHKAQRRWYRLLWKECELRDEIVKLKTILGVVAPDEYTEDGDPRPVQETKEEDSESLSAQYSMTSVVHPKLNEVHQAHKLEFQMLRQQHDDQLNLFLSHHQGIEKLQKSQQLIVQTLLNDHDRQIQGYKHYLSLKKNNPDLLAEMDPKILEEASKFEIQVLHTQLDQIQNVQRKQLKTLQQQHQQDLLAQQNIHKHDKIQKMQAEGGSRQPLNLQLLIQAQKKLEQLQAEHQEQVSDLIDEIHDQQQEKLDELMAQLEQKKQQLVVSENQEQHLNRTQQQLQQLHGKQRVQLINLQNEEIQQLSRCHKHQRKNIEQQIKKEQQELPKDQLLRYLLQQQDQQLAKLKSRLEENNHNMGLMEHHIKDTQEAINELKEVVSQAVTYIDYKPIDIMDLMTRVTKIKETIAKLAKQQTHQQLPVFLLGLMDSYPKDSMRYLQELILAQQQQIQQQYRQEHIVNVLTLEMLQLTDEQHAENEPYHEVLEREKIVAQIYDMLYDLYQLHKDQCERLASLIYQQELIAKFHKDNWKTNQTKDETIDNMGRALLEGKLAYGKNKEYHPLQKIQQENFNAQNVHRDHYRKLQETYRKLPKQTRDPIEQEIQLKRQHEKALEAIEIDTQIIEEEQYEKYDPLTLHQKNIDELKQKHKEYLELMKVKEMIEIRSFGTGYLSAVLKAIEELNPILQTVQMTQEYRLSELLAHHEDLQSKVETISEKLNDEHQFTMTGRQLSNQLNTLEDIRATLQSQGKAFHQDAGKEESCSSSESIRVEEEETDVGDSVNEQKELIQELKTRLITLSTDLQNVNSIAMQRMELLAQKVQKHQLGLQKLHDALQHLMLQCEDLHIEPDKQIMYKSLELYKRLWPCLKAQQQNIHLLMQRLRKKQEKQDYKSPEPATEEPVSIVVEKTEDQEAEDESVSVAPPSPPQPVAGQAASATTLLNKMKQKVEPPRKRSIQHQKEMIQEQLILDELEELSERLQVMDQLHPTDHEAFEKLVSVFDSPDFFRRLQTSSARDTGYLKRHLKLEKDVEEQMEKIKSNPEFYSFLHRRSLCASQKQRLAWLRVLQQSEKPIRHASDKKEKL